jgi:hypothetical protein
MRFQFSRATFVSAAASLIGIALVVNAAFLLLGGELGHALMRAGLGLYCCIWAFVPYNDFLRVARMPVRIVDSAERNSYAKLFPTRLLPAMGLSIALMVGGFVYIAVGVFR